MRNGNVRSLHHAQSGVRGLDGILCGGFRRRHLYVVEGDAGTGKTTLGLQFLLAGAATGERGMFVTLSDTRDDLMLAARNHGWKELDLLDVCEIAPKDIDIGSGVPSERDMPFEETGIDLDDALRGILAVVDEMRPRRLVVDSLSELRLLATDAAQYRRQLYTLKRSLAARACTTLLIDDTLPANDHAVHHIAHGILTLEHLAQDYNRQRRRLHLKKLREPDFRDGYHDYVIRPGGLDVYPRLDSIADDEDEVPPGSDLTSGVPALDALVGGQLEAGTSTLVLGPAGVGKSTVVAQYVAAAAERNESSAVFLFQESRSSWLSRAESVGMKLASSIADGRVVVEHAAATSLSPGELVCRVAERVAEGRSLVVLDGLDALQMAMPGDRTLALHLNELLEHLTQRGVSTMLTLEQHGIADGGACATVWFLADNVLVLRYLDGNGGVRRVVSMMKKRAGSHESTVRELAIRTGTGLWVGDPVSDLSAVLTGVPTYVGEGPTKS